MRTATVRRRTALALLTAVGVAAPVAALAPGATARQIRLDPEAPKDCKLNGTTIRSGSRGRAGGIEYECTDGIACQVEGGRTTGKCSHAARLGVVRGPYGIQIVALARR